MWAHRIYTTDAMLSYWQGQSVYSDTEITSVSPAVLGASRLTINWARSTPAGTQEDLCSINPHFAVAATPGAPISYLDGAAKAVVETEVFTWLAAWAALAANSFNTWQLVWHDIVAGDAFYGPADRFNQLDPGIPGTAGVGRMPDQLAVDLTFRTASRRHWGRAYVPGIGMGKYDSTYGRPTNATCDALASSWRTMINTLRAKPQSIEQVVFSKAYQANLVISELHCDNVADVVRRRRAKQASYRKAFTA